MSQKAIERILITKDNVASVESDIRFHEHLRRYASVRRYCYGRVLDFACGCGYGSHILAANPDVNSVTGVDKDEPSVEWAKREFGSPKTSFNCIDIEKVSDQFDVLVSLEAIEHFNDKSTIPRLVERCGIDQVILSYPNKKSTHFNPFHVHDFCIQELLDLLPEHLCYRTYSMGDVQFLLFVRKPAAAPSHVFRNILDL